MRLYSIAKSASVALAMLGLFASTSAHSAPIMTSTFAFTEHRNATSLWSESHSFIVGSTNVIGGAGLTVTATHVPAGSGPDYSLPLVSSPLFPNQYVARAPYSGQAGQWAVTATDGSGSTTLVTHPLSDVRNLPFVTGLTATGSLLAPHLTWNAVDTHLYPSFCGPAFGSNCAVGFDFFNYQVEVRRIVGGVALQVYQSSGMPTIQIPPGGMLPPGYDPFTPGATVFDIPAGVLAANNDYLIGIRLVHSELESILPSGLFNSQLENRSVYFLEYSTAPVPEPATYAMMLAGLGLLGFAARRRKLKGADRSANGEPHSFSRKS